MSPYMLLSVALGFNSIHILLFGIYASLQQYRLGDAGAPYVGYTHYASSVQCCARSVSQFSGSIAVAYLTVVERWPWPPISKLDYRLASSAPL
jgi:hypothetical protein